MTVKRLPLTKGAVAVVPLKEDYSVTSLIDIADLCLVAGRCTSLSNTYAVVGHGTERQYLHRLILNAPQGTEIDHINGNRLDNRRFNLRFATPGQNRRNKPKPINNTTGFKGIKQTPNGKWIAKIGIPIGKKKHLGTFNTDVEAAHAYDAAALIYHSEFAWLNFSEY